MPDALPRGLGSADVVVLGLAAMLGAGVFCVFAPAAQTAGGWLLLAVALAGVVAACNAFSTADLAARYPQAGGGYIYGRELLAPWAGRLAGVAILVGKIASASAAGGVFATYVLPSHPLCVAIPVIVVAGVLNAAGLRATVRGAWVLASGVLTVLAVVVLVCLIGRAPPAELPMPGPVQLAPPEVTPLGVCTAAGLVFFAFAGYARTATLGPAVRDPDRTLRRAIPLTVLLALLTYLAVGAALLHSLGSARLISEASPLAAAVGMIAAPLGVLVRLGAAAATVSMLFIVLPVVSRTTLAMARRGDLPAWFARVGSRGTSCAGDLVGTLAAALIAALAGPVASVALSACCVLVYYAVVNLAALRLPTRARHWPGWTALLGLLLCLGLAALLPHRQVVVAATVLLLGWLLTTVSSRRSCPGGAAPAEGRSR